MASAAPGTGMPVGIACSWPTESAREASPFTCLFLGDDDSSVMSDAEHAMTSSMENGTCEAARGIVLQSTPDGITAPFVRLLPSICPVMALCVASNARLLEIHAGDGRTAAPPLLTCESTEPTLNGWRTHYLISATPLSLDSPLLPINTEGYTIKFFGRRPAAELKLACFCVICGPPSAAASRVADTTRESEASGESRRGPSRDDNSHVLPTHDIMARLGRFEAQTAAMLQLIASRLDAFEVRLSALEQRADPADRSGRTSP